MDRLKNQPIQTVAAISGSILFSTLISYEHDNVTYRITLVCIWTTWAVQNMNVVMSIIFLHSWCVHFILLLDERKRGNDIMFMTMYVSSLVAVTTIITIKAFLYDLRRDEREMALLQRAELMFRRVDIVLKRRVEINVDCTTRVIDTVAAVN